MISDQYNLKQFAPLFLNKISVSVGLRQSKQSLLQICVSVVVKNNTISYVICHLLLSRSMRSASRSIGAGYEARTRYLVALHAERVALHLPLNQ